MYFYFFFSLLNSLLSKAEKKGALFWSSWQDISSFSRQNQKAYPSDPTDISYQKFLKLFRHHAKCQHESSLSQDTQQYCCQQKTPRSPMPHHIPVFPVLTLESFPPSVVPALMGMEQPPAELTRCLWVDPRAPMSTERIFVALSKLSPSRSLQNNSLEFSLHLHP